MNRLVVVKIGGSLYDLPDLGLRLRELFARMPRPILIFPGGGLTADAIRDFDRIHRLGDEAAHWLALRACALNAHFLARLLPEATVVDRPNDAVAIGIIDPFAFAVEDESRADHWPHHWDVTSDSMAVRLAHIAGASRLTLLKSTNWIGADWAVAAERGIVDPFFPEAVARSRIAAIDIMNLREPEAIPRCPSSD